MALNGNAVLTIAQAKSQLDIPTLDTSQDARLEQLVNAVSDYLENVTGRRLKAQSYTHRFGGSGTPFILLREYPVTAITTVYEDETWAFAGSSIILSTDYAIHKNVQVARRAPLTWQSTKALAIKVTYDAGFAAIPFDLQQAALTLLEVMFDMRDQRSTRLQSRAKLGDSVSFVDKIPEHVTAMIAPHVREAYVKRQLAMA